MKGDQYLNMIDCIVQKDMEEKDEMEEFQDVNNRIKRKLDTIEFTNLDARIQTKKVFTMD